MVGKQNANHVILKGGPITSAATGRIGLTTVRVSVWWCEIGNQIARYIF